MQQRMEIYKSTSKISMLISILLLCIGCGPCEQNLELAFNKQEVHKTFSFGEYCVNEYDSIYFIYPYDDEDITYSLPYKMSNKLRSYCSYTLDDTRVIVLFIKNNEVKAYTEIPAIDAYFTNLVHQKLHIFPLYQKFILDKERNVHIYNK